LEGLRSGEKCKRHLFGSLSSMYLSEPVEGGIPSCIWDMSKLRFLFLSGNLLTGSLPKQAQQNMSTLQYIGLSYNRLSGEIPYFLQGIDAKALRRQEGVRRDFSHNRFVGSLMSSRNVGIINFTNTNISAAITDYLALTLTNSDLSLVAMDVNRLSGRVPRNFFIKSMQHINILAGNIFTCDSHDDLPENDPHYHFYTCGSDSLDYPLLLWVAFLGSAMLVIGATLLLFLVLKWLIPSAVNTKGNDGKDMLASGLTKMMRGAVHDLFTLREKIHEWHVVIGELDPISNMEVIKFMETLVFVRSLAIHIVGFILTAFLLFYCLGKTQWGWYTHVDQYRWLFSAAYLSGSWAALVMMVLLLMVLTLTTYLVNRYCDIGDKKGIGGASQVVPLRGNSLDSGKPVRYTSMRIAASAVTCFCINILIVLSVQGAFVYVTTWHDVSPPVVVGLQLLLASFTLVWDNVVVFKVLIVRFANILTPKGRSQLQNLIIMFNGVVAPVIVVGFTDPNCFSELITTSGEISTISSIEYCAVLNNYGCNDFKTMEIKNEFSPPFTYSFMCSSAVLTKFIPVFVLSNILLSFVIPVILIFLLSFSAKSRRLKSMCMSVLPPILFPTNPTAKKLFSPHVIMSKLLHHIALLLTFGLACPPLAVAILLTVCLTTMSWQLLTGRYVSQRQDHSTLEAAVASENDDKSQSSARMASRLSSTTYNMKEEKQKIYQREVTALNSLCDGVWLCPQTSIWVIVDATAFFSALFVFDISGDRSGWLVASLCFSLPMLCVPVVLRATFKWQCYHTSAIPCCRRHIDGSKTTGSGEVQLQVLKEQTNPLPCHEP